ncbi:hypothetical protein AB1E18_004353 [Capra hircus]
MVIVDVKMIPGFIPLKPIVKKDRSEQQQCPDLRGTGTNQTLSFSFCVLQDIPVGNLQPAIMKVYDYYKTDEPAFAEYRTPCNTDAELGNI